LTDKLTLFLIRSLDRGGAERQLITLARGLSQRGCHVAVVVFYRGGALDAELTAAGVRLISMDKKGRWDLLAFLFRLARLMRKERPAVLHAYLTVPNLLSVMLRPLLPSTRIVWGVRASDMDLSRYDRLSRFTDIIEQKLSRYADLIIANSHAGKYHAVKKGFPENKIVVIPNGIDTSRFIFNPEKRRRLREEWGVGDNELLIGLTARLDPMKDHPTFLQAAGLIARERGAVRFVCVGKGTIYYSEALEKQAVVLGISDKLIWAGARDDMPGVYSALDIACSSSSFGEGFSNTIAEGMACGVPAVVTDVGDSAWIVGKIGVVVPPSDPQALMQGMLKLMDMPKGQRQILGEKSRERIMAEFSVEALISSTERILDLKRCV
jgi:glycosyltransferase involved in cell wall biosynthesis